MRLFKSGPTVGSILALLLCLAVSPTAFAQTTWVSTATRGIALSSLSNATDLGALPSQTPVHVTVGLEVRNVSALKQLVKSQNTPGDPLYGTELTPDQFLVSFGPTSNQVQAVSNYLSSFGFTNISVEPNNVLVQADGTAAAANAAFNTSLEQFNLNGALVYANTRAAQVPASLGGTVVAVLGLNTVNQVRVAQFPVCGVPPASFGCVGNSLPPQGFQKAYDVGTTPTGQNTTIAIFTFGSVAGRVNDLRNAELANGLPQVPVVVKQVGIPNPTDYGGIEWEMDTQMSTGMAQSVKTLYLYTVTHPFDADVALMFNRFVTDKLARAGSASFGECEYGPFIDGTMLVTDEIFLQGAAQGQTLFASSGDAGSACGVGLPNGVPGSGPPMVEWPAASEYVVGVGGTSLTVNSDNSYNTEIAWNSGGGGISQFEPCSFWQSDSTIASCNNNSRGVPDIAMNADPNFTGATLYYQCTGTSNPHSCVNPGWGGTSLSSPLALGVWARLQSGHGNKLGYAAPKLYQFYKQNGPLGNPSSVDPGYHDIILGANGAYPAGYGYDFVTGLGTFDVSKISALFGPTSTGGGGGGSCTGKTNCD
jgi:pseudomonalisin